MNLRSVIYLGFCAAILAVLVLFDPFLVNIYKYGSPIYPVNYQWAANDLLAENIPHNLSGANKFELLFYGIYSETQTPSAASDPSNIAQLKIPFTVGPGELSNIAAVEPSERVSDAGVLYSGVFTLSLIILLILYLFDSSKRDKFLLRICACIIILILICALATPTPNVIRYTPLLTFIPVLSLIVIVLIDRPRIFSWLRVGKFLLAGFIVINTAISLYCIETSTLRETLQLDRQLSIMSKSGIVYNVYAPGFYSSYTRLKEAGVKFYETQNLGCDNPQTLDFTYGEYATEFCPRKS